LSGGDGDDVFIVNGTADIEAGESYIGGDDNDSLSVTATTDFTDITALTSVETIVAADGVALTFAAERLTGQTIAINGTGNNGGESLTVNGSAAGEVINLGGLTLDANDFAGLSVDAGDGADTITGTTAGDRIALGATDGDADTLILRASDTSTALFTNGSSTAAMDIISQAEIGDMLDIVPNLIGTAVTYASDNNGYLTAGNADAVRVIRGTYNLGAQTFSYDDAGNDYMLQWSEAGNAAINSVVFEDYGTDGLGLTVGAGTLALAAAPALGITLVSVLSTGIFHRRGHCANQKQCGHLSHSINEYWCQHRLHIYIGRYVSR
jgi:hypothetical protein